MFQGEFKFDLNDATTMGRPEYISTYHTTNEPLAEWMDLIPVENRRVLTVAASGDQALSYAAHGASHIDTFDITINACAIMDFKTTALRLMDHMEYHSTVRNMAYIFNPKGYANINRVAAKMPQRTRTLMQNIIKKRTSAFSHGASESPIFPMSDRLYLKIQQSVHAPFNFIWTDLMNLHNYIQGKYDIINTSNIFDHYLWGTRGTSDISKTIETLWPHLNAGGYIFCTTTETIMQYCFRPDADTWDAMDAEISFPSIPQGTFFQPILIQKIR